MVKLHQNGMEKRLLQGTYNNDRPLAVLEHQPGVQQDGLVTASLYTAAVVGPMGILYPVLYCI